MCELHQLFEASIVPMQIEENGQINPFSLKQVSLQVDPPFESSPARKCGFPSLTPEVRKFPPPNYLLGNTVTWYISFNEPHST